MNKRTDVIIIGAGIIGTMLAYHLAKSGRSVRLLEKTSPGQEASGAFAGLLTTIAEGDEAGPYLTLSQVSLQTSRETIQQVEEETGLTTGLQCVPLYRMASTSQEQEKLYQYWQRQQRQGGHDEWLDGPTLRARLPESSPRLLGAIYAPAEYHVTPALLINALLTAAKQHGVIIQPQSNVTRLLAQGQRITSVQVDEQIYEAQDTILAAGAWTPQLLQPLSVQLPVTPKKGQMLVLSCPDSSLSSIITAHAGYIVPKPDGTVVVGATYEDAGFNKEMTVGGLAQLLRILSAYPLLMRGTIRHFFAGLRPMSPDGMPLLGPLPSWDHLLIATGHSQHGILLADVTARLTTSYLNGEDVDALWTQFQVSRAVSTQA